MSSSKGTTPGERRRRHLGRIAVDGPSLLADAIGLGDRMPLVFQIELDGREVGFALDLLVEEVHVREAVDRLAIHRQDHLAHFAACSFREIWCGHPKAPGAQDPVGYRGSNLETDAFLGR
jgi:hypothetical protein